MDLIVEGSLMKADKHLWARSYDRTLKDLLSLQAEVATAIGREVKGAISPMQTARLSGGRARVPSGAHRCAHPMARGQR